MRVMSSIILAAALAACAQPPQPQQACTLIGCESGLSVVVEPAPAGSYTVIAEAENSTQTVECGPQRRCTEGAFFGGFTPESATIRVIVGTDTTTTAVTPAYETTQPNGPDCPPTCRQATVTVSTESGDDADE